MPTLSQTRKAQKLAQEKRELRQLILDSKVEETPVALALKAAAKKK